LVGGESDAGAVSGSELGKPEPKKLIADGSNAEFMPPDRVIFARASTLMAQTIDVGKLVTKGDHTPLPLGRVAYWSNRESPDNSG